MDTKLLAMDGIIIKTPISYSYKLPEAKIQAYSCIIRKS